MEQKNVIETIPNLEFECLLESPLDVSRDVLNTALTKKGFLLVDFKIDGRKLDLTLFSGQLRHYKKIIFSIIKALKNFHRPLSIKLSKSNYVLWRQSIEQLPILGGSSVRSIVLLREDGYLYKYYHPLVPQNFENEKQAYENPLISNIALQDVVLENNIIKLPYVSNNWVWDYPRFKLFPYKKLKQVISVMQQLHSHRVYLVDWAPDAFLFHDGKINLVDFEYSYTKDNERSFVESYDIAGIMGVKKAPEFSVISYEGSWYNRTGIKLGSLLNKSDLHCRVEQCAFYVTRFFPKAFIKMFDEAFSYLKKQIKYALTLKVENGIIEYKKL